MDYSNPVDSPSGFCITQLQGEMEYGAVFFFLTLILIGEGRRSFGLLVVNIIYGVDSIPKIGLFVTAKLF